MKLSKSYNRLSFKTKLRLTYSLIACGMFYITAVIIEHGLSSRLSQQNNEFIAYRLQALHAIIDFRPDYVEVIRKDLDWESFNISTPEYYVRILDSSGRTAVESLGMDVLIPARLFPPVSKRNGNKDVIIKAPNNRFFLLKSDSGPLEGAGRMGSIQIALDVTTEKNIDIANQKTIYLALFLVLVVSFAVGELVLRQLLLPLKKINDFSRQITVETLNERINPNSWPTELRQFASIYNTMLARLEQSFSRLSECISNMAHDLRTPLNNIMGEAEIALLKLRTPEEYQHVLESGREECLRLSRTIDNVLLLAHTENPATRIERTQFDPIADIREICRFYAPMIEEHGAKVSYHGSGDMLLADPALFRRAISNLLVNSLTYSATGVEIDLSVRQTDGKYVEVAIRDNGYGIAEEDQARLFERFYRGDHSRSNYRNGSGLGLSIVKSIMELHDGTVAVDSRPGNGTTFTLRFPQKSSCMISE